MDTLLDVLRSRVQSGAAKMKISLQSGELISIELKAPGQSGSVATPRSVSSIGTFGSSGTSRSAAKTRKIYILKSRLDSERKKSRILKKMNMELRMDNEVNINQGHSNEYLISENKENTPRNGDGDDGDGDGDGDGQMIPITLEDTDALPSTPIVLPAASLSTIMQPSRSHSSASQNTTRNTFSSLMSGVGMTSTSSGSSGVENANRDREKIIEMQRRDVMLLKKTLAYYRAKSATLVAQATLSTIHSERLSMLLEDVTMKSSEIESERVILNSTVESLKEQLIDSRAISNSHEAKQKSFHNMIKGREKDEQEMANMRGMVVSLENEKDELKSFANELLTEMRLMEKSNESLRTRLEQLERQKEQREAAYCPPEIMKMVTCSNELYYT